MAQTALMASCLVEGAVMDKLLKQIDDRNRETNEAITKMRSERELENLTPMALLVLGVTLCLMMI